MGLRTNQLQNIQTATKDQPAKGDANYVEPIPGVQLSEEEQIEQFSKDFGDVLLDDVIEDSVPEQIVPELPDRRDDSTTQPPKKKAQTIQPEAPKVDMSAYVAKTEHEELTRKYNDLQGKFNELQGKFNNLGDLGKVSLDEIKVLRKIKYDVETTPLGIMVEDFYRNKIDVSKFVPAKKTAQEYMPENEQFIVEDAFNNPNSNSYKARTQFDNDQREIKEKYLQVGNYIKQTAAQASPEEASEQWKKEEERLIGELVTKVPTASKHKESFINWLQKQDNIYLLAWVAYTQAINAAIRKKKGISQPEQTVFPKRGAVASDNYDNVDEAIEKEFGPDIGGL